MNKNDIDNKRKNILIHISTSSFLDMDNVIDKEITNNDDIVYFLKLISISDDIRLKIIERKVNEKNILYIYDHIYAFNDYLADEMYKMKSDELLKAVKKLNVAQVAHYLDDFYVPSKVIVRALGELKLDAIKKVSKLYSLSSIERALTTIEDENVIKAIYETRKKTLFNSIKLMNDTTILNYLENKNIPDEFKRAIFTNSKKIPKIIKNMSINRICNNYLTTSYFFPSYFCDLILEMRKKEIYDYVKANDPINILTYYSPSKTYAKYLIENFVNNTNFTSLQPFARDYVYELFISLKSDIIMEQLNDFNIFNRIFFDDRLSLLIISKYKDYLFEKLAKYDDNELFKMLINPTYSYPIKNLILDYFNIKENDKNYILSLASKFHDFKVIKRYDDIKNFIINSSINFDTFMQYGSNSNNYYDWFNKILEIIDNKKVDDFLRIKNYLFSKYYEDKNDTNSVLEICNYLELIFNFSNKYLLLDRLALDNTDLNKNKKVSLYFMLKDKKYVCSNDDIDTYRKSMFERYNKCDASNLTLYEIKDVFNRILFCNLYDEVENIGGVTPLKSLLLDNRDSIVMKNKIEELITYIRFMELINNNTSLDALRNVFNYTFSNYELMADIQNIYFDFDKKIRELYEADARVNLSSLKFAPHNLELEEKYGGIVYDLSDTNYVLYAHLLSGSEDIKDLIDGKSSGQRNFISMSPISYKGQKYYNNTLNLWNLILAFNDIPKGSFICSSMENMGTNRKVDVNSCEIDKIARDQRGILETSSVTSNNSEVLLYREGVMPCGIIIPKDNEFSKKYLEYHKKYNLPLIITQSVNTLIENSKQVFSKNDISVKYESLDEINHLINIVEKDMKDKNNVSNINTSDDKYTGRNIALFTDCHGMFEPTIAVLEDIKNQGIDEIYSLGDNIGLGPNPCEVLDLLSLYKVNSVAGNSEYYHTLGFDSFSYFDYEKYENEMWTNNKLGSKYIDNLKLYAPSIDLSLGGKKIALCHFVNDVRWDYTKHNVHGFVRNEDPKQFLYTNSYYAKGDLNNLLNSRNSKYLNGVMSSLEKPLFDGKNILNYDHIFQGHAHFDIDTKLNDTSIKTLRACGMGEYNLDLKDKACYYILREFKNNEGFTIEKKYVPFNKKYLICNINTSSLPHKKKILSYLK